MENVKMAKDGRKTRPIRRIKVIFCVYIYSRRPGTDIFRSYLREYSDTHQNIELKHGWAGLVLG